MNVYDRATFEPDRSIGYLVRRVNQVGSLALEPKFEAEGLTGVHWSVLASLHFARAATSADLARDLCYDKGAMTRLIDTLEERGWITRERDQDDRRIIRLALTDAGSAVTLCCRDRVIATWNGWLAEWDRRDVETLIALLQKLRGTLDAAAPERCA